DSVKQTLLVEEFNFAFNFFTESFRNSNRIHVLWLNQANHVVAIQFRESIRHRPTRPFSRIAFSPTLARQRPATFESRPAGRVHQTDAANHSAAGFLFNRPRAIAATVPVADMRGH